MAYPSSIDTFNGTTAQGTSTLSSPDHALDHRTLGSAAGTIEQVIGTTSGTAILMNFTAGQFAIASPGGTLNAGILGTPAITGGTIGTAIIGTSTMQGGTASSVAIQGTSQIGTPMIRGGTVGTAVIGTSTIQGGTANNQVVGTPTITGPSIIGGTINNAILGTPIISRVGSTSASDTRIDADTAGSKVVTLTMARQGGTATDWNVAGTANFYVSNVFIQAGILSLPDTSAYSGTFPIAFSKPPVIVGALENDQNAGQQNYMIIAKSTSAFTAVAGATGNGTTVLNWLAIGER